MLSLFNGSKLPHLDFEDAFLMTKIRANLLSYSSNASFLYVWYQQSEVGITALLCKFEQSVIIVADASADFDEIKEFLNVIGFKNLQSTPFVLNKLGFDYTEYQVLFKMAENGGTLPPMPSIRAVYDILYGEKNSHIEKVDFEGFYVDLCHRIRHGTAAAVLNDSAVCVASHITDSAAVISGVATNKAARKMGLGSMVLDKLLKTLDGRKVFAAAESSVVPFYAKNGFVKSHKTAIYNIEE